MDSAQENMTPKTARTPKVHLSATLVANVTQYSVTDAKGDLLSLLIHLSRSYLFVFLGKS